LESDDAIEAELAGAVDDAHAAAGDFLEQLIIAEMATLARRRRGRGAAGEVGRGHGGLDPGLGRIVGAGTGLRSLRAAEDGLCKKTSRLPMSFEERRDPVMQEAIARAGFSQVGRLLLGRCLAEGGSEDGFNSIRAQTHHRPTGLGSSTTLCAVSRPRASSSRTTMSNGRKD